MMAKVNSSADDVNRMTSSLAAQVNAANPASLLAKFHKSTDDINAMTADARPKVEKTLTSIQNTAQQVESISKKDVVEILAAMRKVTTDVLKISGNFVQVSEQAKSIVVVNHDRIDELIENMGQVSDNLKATAKEVRRNPWRLLHKPEKEELHSQNLYDAARAFASGAEDLNAALDKLRAGQGESQRHRRQRPGTGQDPQGNRRHLQQFLQGRAGTVEGSGEVGNSDFGFRISDRNVRRTHGGRRRPYGGTRPRSVPSTRLATSSTAASVMPSRSETIVAEAEAEAVAVMSTAPETASVGGGFQIGRGLGP